MRFDLSPEGVRHEITKKKLTLYADLFSLQSCLMTQHDRRLMSLLFSDPDVQKHLNPIDTIPYDPS